MTAPTREQATRALGAAVAGNVLEWYDFAVYAYLAAALAKQFFPSEDEVTSLLSAFAVFGIGFLVRPLGGILIGRLGDLKGRKTALLLTIALMTVGTVMIGLIPSYAAIGVAAPALVVVGRLLQGFSAGGEWGGATAFMVEWAPEGRRGLFGSLQQCSVAGGLLLGSAVAAVISTLLSPEAMESWGWRIPFLLGALLGPVGLYMRRHVGETPAYTRAMQQSDRGPSNPAHGAPALTLAARAFGFTILWTVSYYIVLAYMPTFLHNQAGIERTQALWSTTAALVVLMVATPVMGYVSDRLGRKPLLVTVCVAFALLPYPLFKLLLASPSLPLAIAVQTFLALVIAVFSGPGPAAIAEIFPTRVRTTWMSTGYSLAVAIFGGFAPFIATWLIGWTGNPLSPAYYLMAAAVVSLLVIIELKETARVPLD